MMNPNFLSATPQSPQELLQVAVGLHQLGKLQSACLLYSKILAHNPKHFDSLHLLGIAAAQLGDANQAVNLIKSALRVQPNNAIAHYNLGNVLKDLKRLREATDSYRRAIKLKPDYWEAFSNLSSALQEIGEPEQALACIDRALELKPTCSNAHCNRGISLLQVGRKEEAFDALDRAIQLDPGNAEAHNNRGNVLKRMMRFSEAIQSYDRAIHIRPDYAEAFSNRGHALHELKLLDEALRSYNRAIEINPNLYEALWNKALLFLSIGEFTKGWPLYESRWKGSKLKRAYRKFTQPLWLGMENPSGKTILLHAEQGLGDTIQFGRYARVLSELGARVILEVQAPLVELFKCLEGVSHLVRRGDPLPPFDLHCPLMSLPLALQSQLMPPEPQFPYLIAQPLRVSKWARRLGQTGLRVGICWQGKASSESDQGRSFRVTEFSAIAANPEVRLVSLHKGDGEDQLKDLPAGMRVELPGSDFDQDAAFVDTAAIMKNLDLVITSDTAVAHLAGALGVPVWVVLKRVPDWRWMLDRSDCPWYPTMRLFRQSKSGDWTGVFNEIATEVKRLLVDTSRHRTPVLACSAKEQFFTATKVPQKHSPSKVRP